ncbi:MAG TPA: UDP-N-acetylglucosamine 1-carboxyvinyltransferase, partial [Bacillota bacterium]|nr:UDP-N-acetylglucosamine 1-carboxyvinyltransferase [Bacillota bacterium]
RDQILEEIMRMGADVRFERDRAIINGVPRLTGAPVEVADLRAGAALVIAGLAANGETVISGVELIDRGYERIETKLRDIGADIIRETINMVK